MSFSEWLSKRYPINSGRVPEGVVGSEKYHRQRADAWMARAESAEKERDAWKAQADLHARVSDGQGAELLTLSADIEALKVAHELVKKERDEAYDEGFTNGLADTGFALSDLHRVIKERDALKVLVEFQEKQARCVPDFKEEYDAVVKERDELRRDLHKTRIIPGTERLHAQIGRLERALEYTKGVMKFYKNGTEFLSQTEKLERGE